MIGSLLNIDDLPDKMSGSSKLRQAVDQFRDGRCKGAFIGLKRLTLTEPVEIPPGFQLIGIDADVHINLNDPEADAIKCEVHKDVYASRQRFQGLNVLVLSPVRAVFNCRNGWNQYFDDVTVNGRNSARFGIIQGTGDGNLRSVGNILYRVRVSNCVEAGLWLNNCGANQSLQHCGISRNQKGVIGSAEELTISQCSISQNTACAIDLEGGTRLTVMDSYFEQGEIRLKDVRVLSFLRNKHTGGKIHTDNVQVVNLQDNRLQSDTIRVESEEVPALLATGNQVQLIGKFNQMIEDYRGEKTALGNIEF